MLKKRYQKIPVYSDFIDVHEITITLTINADSLLPFLVDPREIMENTIFIDSIKIQANANKNSFVWKKQSNEMKQVLLKKQKLSIRS